MNSPSLDSSPLDLNIDYHQSLRFATLNIHGARGKEAEIDQLSSEVDILGICETWLLPQDLSLAKLFNEPVCGSQSHGYWRGQGGVAIRLNPFISYSVLHQYSSTESQVLVIKAGDLSVAAVYIAPNASREVFLTCLTSVSHSSLSKAVIVGDLNARFRTWDHSTNSHGKWLVEWSKSFGWNIHPPEEPTFSSHQGTSTVDLFLTKGVYTTGSSVLHGPWDGSSDHFAVGTNKCNSDTKDPDSSNPAKSAA